MDILKMTYKTIEDSLIKDYDKYKCTSDSINHQLRANIPIEDINFQVKPFDSLIQKFETKIEIKLYRVLPLEFIEVFNVNDIYSDKGYFSTSIDRDNILQFCKYPRIAVIVVSCKPETHMINMELSETVSGNEGEYLLDRDSKFLIVDKREFNDYNEILEYFDGDKDCAINTQKLVEFSVLKTI
jgi:hypothetical protein